MHRRGCSPTPGTIDQLPLEMEPAVPHARFDQVGSMHGDRQHSEFDLRSIFLYQRCAQGVHNVHN